MRIVLVATLLLAGLAARVEAKHFIAQASDFTCLATWPKVHHTRVFNKDPKALAKAMNVIELGLPHKNFPVGTILQLWPGEASVKRGGSKNHGWEFFALSTTAAGTTITNRGPHTINVFNHSECRTCHAAAKKFDFFCEHGHGCVELGLPDTVFDNLQANDVRCQPAH